MGFYKGLVYAWNPTHNSISSTFYIIKATNPNDTNCSAAKKSSDIISSIIQKILEVYMALYLTIPHGRHS